MFCDTFYLPVSRVHFYSRMCSSLKCITVIWWIPSLEILVNFWKRGGERKKKKEKREEGYIQPGTRWPPCFIFAGGRKDQLNEVREATLVTAAKCELYVFISLTLHPFLPPSLTSVMISVDVKHHVYLFAPCLLICPLCVRLSCCQTCKQWSVYYCGCLQWWRNKTEWDSRWTLYTIASGRLDSNWCAHFLLCGCVVVYKNG